MVLSASPLSLLSHPSPSLTLSPAKIHSSNSLILRTPYLILRLSSSLPLSPALSLVPLSRRNIFACIVGASPTHKYVYPDPIPEFAESETRKFRAELLERLSGYKDEFGDELHAVVDVCAQCLERNVLEKMREQGYNFLVSLLTLRSSRKLIKDSSIQHAVALCLRSRELLRLEK
ncbi:protein PLASTID REDOX INSENSITIVE 2, chloroplastic-like [Senna tora]|uniref:Protein PLASTID REDOX INSENSITIVE 2, chloroplastic-like n=1 Tax=Senna tora TaxID=362788 RepID=A0A834W882_9FABA|nr:protein PLASTID REDOX INSENSITIVE 2, chloroplastic-like [Senna tora]